MIKKTILLLLISIIYANASIAQKSLKFIQAKLVTTIQTVPAGKVWKAVGVYTDQTSFGNHSDANTPAILVNGVKNYYVIPMPRGTGFFSYAPAGFPVWFPAGTSLAVSNKIKYINVLEFEIVP